jgi:hypothetical protein
VSTYNATGLVYDQSNLTFDGNPAGLSNMPVMGVFVAFDDGPYVADPDWVEVTDYVRDINIRRGRQDDLQQFPSGSCSITFDNRDRLFDPFNTAGAYYGKLKPRRQVRVVGQWNGVNYPLFRGFVAGWPVEFTDGGKDSTVTVDCFDALGLMATEVIPTDFVDLYTRSLQPQHYWKIDDGPVATELKDVIGGFNIPRRDFGVRFFEAQPLADGIKSNALYFRTAFTDARSTVGGLQTSMSVAFWVMGASSSSNTRGYTVSWISGGLNVQLQFLSGTAGYPRILYTTLTAQYIRTFDTPSIIRFDQPQHWVITFDSSTLALTVYVDGAVTTTTLTSTVVSSRGEFENINLEGTTIQEISTYRRILSATEVADLYAVSTARVSETSAARMNRLIGLTSWPSELAAFDSATSIDVLDIGKTDTVFDEMLKTVVSEQGELFASSSGVLTFVPQEYWASRSRSNTSQVSFTDTGTGVFYDAGAVRMRLDADRIRNDINLQFSTGGKVTASDTASIAENGAANETLDTYIGVPTQAQSVVDQRLVLYKDPKIEVEPFLVKGQRNPSYDWPRLLNLELLDRFTFVRTPSVGSAIQKDMLLQSIEHRITPGTWETTINGSARYTGWFILGVSLLGSTEDVLL